MIDTAQVLAICLAVMLTAMLAAIGWLVRTVINHSIKIASICSATSEKDDSREEIKTLLRGLEKRLVDTHADVHTVCERTAGLVRTTDRHERFLERITGPIVGSGVETAS